MASLKELKLRINSVKSTQKITKAKQMVAAAKLRKAQASAEAARPYARRLAAVVASLATKASAQASMPRLLVGTGSDQKHLLVVANSDKGLAGAFNSNIVRAALTKAAELKAAGKTVKFYLIGRKGRAPIRRAWPNAIAQMFDTVEIREPGYPEAEQVVTELVELFRAGRFDVAHLFFSTFKSALTQEPTEVQIFPVPATAAAESNAAAVEYELDVTIFRPANTSSKRSTSTSSSPDASTATRAFRCTRTSAHPTEASTPMCPGPSRTPRATATSPFLRSSALGRTFLPQSRSATTMTEDVPPSVSSTRMTLSAPAGTGPPVMMRIASPGPTARSVTTPAATVPTTRSDLGLPALAPRTSSARTA